MEPAVQRLYVRLAPPTEHIDTIRVKLDQALAGMRAQTQHGSSAGSPKLADERTKLLHAYYQSAIPVDLLH